MLNLIRQFHDLTNLTLHKPAAIETKDATTDPCQISTTRLDNTGVNTDTVPLVHTAVNTKSITYAVRATSTDTDPSKAYESLLAKNVRISREVDRLENVLLSSEQELARFEAELAEKKASIEESSIAFNLSIEKLEESITLQKERIIIAEGLTGSLSTERDEERAEKERIQEELVAAQNRIASLESEIAMTRSTLDSAQKELVDLQASSAIAHDRLTSSLLDQELLNSQVETLRGEIDTGTIALEVTKQNLAAIRIAEIQLRDELATAQMSVQSLTADAISTAETISSLTSSLTLTEEYLKSTRINLELGQSRNKELSDEIARLEKVQAATESILDNTRDQLKEEVSNSASLKKKYDSVVLCVDS